MLVFETIEKHVWLLGLLGFKLPQFLRSFEGFYKKLFQLFVSSIFLFVFIPALLFMLFRTKKIEDYGEPFTIVTSFGLCTICYWAMIHDSSNIVLLTAKLREIVKKSKFGTSFSARRIL